MDKPETIMIAGIEVEIVKHNEPKETFDDPNTRFSYLIAGSRDPQDEEEEKFLEEVNEMKKKGIIIELPFN